MQGPTFTSTLQLKLSYIIVGRIHSFPCFGFLWDPPSLFYTHIHISLPYCTEHRKKKKKTTKDILNRVFYSEVKHTHTSKALVLLLFCFAYSGVFVIETVGLFGSWPFSWTLFELHLIVFLIFFLLCWFSLVSNESLWHLNKGQVNQTWSLCSNSFVVLYNNNNNNRKNAKLWSTLMLGSGKPKSLLNKWEFQYNFNFNTICYLFVCYRCSIPFVRLVVGEAGKYHLLWIRWLDVLMSNRKFFDIESETQREGKRERERERFGKHNTQIKDLTYRLITPR